MFVITSGNGNIDLSVQYTMPLAGFVAISVMSGGGVGRVVLGTLAAVAVGLAIAAANLFCILVLAIPPIVATLSVGLMGYSASSIQAQSFSALPDPGLHAFTVSSVAGRFLARPSLCRPRPGRRRSAPPHHLRAGVAGRGPEPARCQPGRPARDQGHYPLLRRVRGACRRLRPSVWPLTCPRRSRSVSRTC